MKQFALVMMLVSGALLTGCTFTHQAVKVEPVVDVSDSNVGQGRAVRVHVVDERPKSTLGTRGARGVGADMTIEGDITEIFRSAIERGLLTQGFRPSRDPGEERELRVELRSLDYNVIVGFWAGTLKVDCALKGICRHGAVAPFERLHRGEFTESVQVVQGAEANNRYVSDAASKAVNSLLGDRDLLRCLAE